MRKYKIIITSLICTFLVLNFVFSNSNFVDLEQIANIEFEAESENESEVNNKSKLGYLALALNINFDFKNFLNFDVSLNSLSCHNVICEVPSSPPNNC